MIRFEVQEEPMIPLGNNKLYTNYSVSFSVYMKRGITVPF